MEAKSFFDFKAYPKHFPFWYGFFLCVAFLLTWAYLPESFYKILSELSGVKVVSLDTLDIERQKRYSLLIVAFAVSFLLQKRFRSVCRTFFRIGVAFLLIMICLFLGIMVCFFMFSYEQYGSKVVNINKCINFLIIGPLLLISLFGYRSFFSVRSS